MPRDNQPLDLAGPFTDGHQAVAVVDPLDELFARITVTLLEGLKLLAFSQGLVFMTNDT